VFRHHTNSVKLLVSVFGHGRPRRKWITIWNRLANVFKLCACILQKSLKLDITWYLPLDVTGVFCVWVKAFNLNFNKGLTKREENHRDTAPLSRWMFQLTWGICPSKKISSNYGFCTAEQWKNWTLIYSMYALKEVIGDNHLQCWWDPVLEIHCHNCGPTKSWPTPSEILQVWKIFWRHYSKRTSSLSHKGHYGGPWSIVFGASVLRDTMVVIYKQEIFGT